jgi:hypothetical protein
MPDCLPLERSQIAKLAVKARKVATKAALSEPAAIQERSAWELFGAEDKQGDTKNDQQMYGLKQPFKHGALLSLSPSTEFL